MVHKPDPTGVKPKGFGWNRGSFSDIDEAVANILLWDAEPTTTIYFSVGSFADNRVIRPDGKEKIERKQTQATFFKAFALDLDIGAKTPYATKAEGMKAIMPALNAIGMPDPMVISSGNGIHLYWPLTEKISRDHWEHFSMALRIALEEQGVVIDTTKIHDPSMVLRPVGSHHKKQSPWKEVKCVADCPDYDTMSLLTILKPWAKNLVSAKKPQSRKPVKSSILDAVLNSNDIILEAVASRCKQIAALVDSGGVLDAAGRDVQEPLWRTSMGFAKYCVDPKEAVIKLAGKHKDFDLDDSMSKMAGWNATGPSTCAKFEQMCSKGCEGCPSRGVITSPAQLSVVTETELVNEIGEVVEITMPKNYVVKNNHIYKEVITEVNTRDANGVEVAQDVLELDLVSPYEMHVTGIFYDPDSKRSAFRLAIKYPMIGWKEDDHEMSVIATIGKDFSTFLLNRQVYLRSIGQQEKVRGYLMDYLTMVQSTTPTGMDFISFGWQEDGSFLCGEKVIGSPHGTVERRLRGPAERFKDIIKTHGTREAWVTAMHMLNEPGTDTLRAATLIATTGILGNVAGNSQIVVSIYSTETTTGKTLALLSANSLIGNPKALLLNKNDTENALYKMRGVHNNLPTTIDELTSIDAAYAAELTYQLSQGREKISMTKERELRTPVVWFAPTLVTTNVSMHQKIETIQSNNDPLTTRMLELHHHNRIFVATTEDGSSNGYKFFDLIDKNNGWAFPELVEAVLAMGGPEVVWTKGEAAFLRKFKFLFEPQERFYRTAIIGSWIMGMLGKKLGLFPFDIEATTQYLLDHIVGFRESRVADKQDVFDTIGQYLLENNDKIVECTERYGSGKEQVRQPAPEKAVARIKVVYDDKNPILPGSTISLNTHLFRAWLARTRDGVDRVERELADNGALIAKRDRVTMFKGCSGRNPSQTHCLIINLNHPRLAAALTGTVAREQSPIALAVLQGSAAA